MMISKNQIKGNIKNKNKFFKTKFTLKQAFSIKKIILCINLLIMLYFSSIIEDKWRIIVSFVLFNLFLMISTFEINSLNNQKNILENTNLISANYSIERRVNIYLCTTFMYLFYENFSILIPAAVVFFLFQKKFAIIYIVLSINMIFFIKKAKTYRRIISEKNINSFEKTSKKIFLRLFWSLLSIILSLKVMNYLVSKIRYARSHIETLSDLLNYSLDEKYFMQIVSEKYYFVLYNIKCLIVNYVKIIVVVALINIMFLI